MQSAEFTETCSHRVRLTDRALKNLLKPMTLGAGIPLAIGTPACLTEGGMAYFSLLAFRCF